jgi:hypothetical protein
VTIVHQKFRNAFCLQELPWTILRLRTLNQFVRETLPLGLCSAKLPVEIPARAL